MSEPLLWTCDECGKPVTDGDGWVTIDYAELNAYRDATADWEKAHPTPEHGLRCFSLTDLMELPDPVRWHVWHRACDPNIDSCDYCIDVERIRTAAQILKWTAHLMEKTWLPDTTWRDLLRGQAERLRKAA